MDNSDDIIEEVRSRSDIVDVVSEYVKLQKKGANYFGLCPFHSEKSGSFSVSAGKQMYYCFGCHKGGNVYSFIMEYEGVGFKEALSKLAYRAGVELPPNMQISDDRKKREQRDLIFDANNEAAKFYVRKLRSKEGEIAQRYFLQRQLKPETITGFGLGYSGIHKDELYRFLKEKGFNDETLSKTGLFTYGDREVTDYFRNRVMFPIFNIAGKVIGFGGRVMGDYKPKYLNTKETIVFDKGHNLYGLNFAKKGLNKDNIIICEGYMDVIAMHQAGFTQAVASLGTALTAGQVSLIKKHVQDVLICYDSDGAGRDAALKAIKLFRREGLRTKVVNLTPYKDADELIKAEGKEEFEKRLESAENSFIFEIETRRFGLDSKDPTVRTQFFNDAARKILETFDSEMEIKIYAEAVAEKFGIGFKEFWDTVKQIANQGVRKVSDVRVTDEEREVRYRTGKNDNGIKKAQRMLLTWLCDRPSIYPLVSKYIAVSDFSEEVYKKTAEIIFESFEKGDFNPARILNSFSAEEQSEVAEILNSSFLEGEDLDVGKAITETVKKIKTDSLKRKYEGVTDVSVFQKIIAEENEIKKINIIVR